MASNRKDIMNDSLNPFDRVLENYQYPLARIYRESFWTGIADTYDVIVGNHYRLSDNEATHAGVLDILLFPLLSQWLARIAFPTLKNIVYEEQPSNGQENEVLTFRHSDGTTSQKILSKTPAAPLPIRLIAGFFAGLLEVPRALIGGGLTLLVVPIVAIVHAVTAPKAHKLRNQVSELPITFKKLEPDPVNKHRLSTKIINEKLGSYLTHAGWGSKLTDISAKTNDDNTYIVREGSKLETKFNLMKCDDNTKAHKAFEKLNIGKRRIGR